VGIFLKTRLPRSNQLIGSLNEFTPLRFSSDNLSGNWRVSGISASSGAFNYNMKLTQADGGAVTGGVKSEDMKIEGTYDAIEGTFTFTQVSCVSCRSVVVQNGRLMCCGICRTWVKRRTLAAPSAQAQRCCRANTPRAPVVAVASASPRGSRRGYAGGGYGRFHREGKGGGELSPLPPQPLALSPVQAQTGRYQMPLQGRGVCVWGDNIIYNILY
jgi:hypothetical protein